MAHTMSTNTTYRIYPSGAEVTVEHCHACKSTQITEYIEGPTVKIQNQEDGKTNAT